MFVAMIMTRMCTSRLAQRAAIEMHPCCKSMTCSCMYALARRQPAQLQLQHPAAAASFRNTRLSTTFTPSHAVHGIFNISALVSQATAASSRGPPAAAGLQQHQSTPDTG
jgi:hypothetical protein